MRKHCLLVCALLLLCTHLLLAQDRTISGKILDPSGKPIPGASIIIKGTRSGTSSGTDGSYSLRIVENGTTLVVSAIGWTNEEVSIGNRSSINVILSVKDNTLSEVVVTSLGIVRDKRSLGYATQNIKGDQLADRGSVNLVNALEGKVSGVNITGASGSAGASVNINIRGITSFTKSNQPLFVVDGIPISNDVDRTNGGPNGTLGDNQPPNRAMDLDLNNIESVNVLKGPAASALYGSRAAAGAIIITTKKGGGPGGKSEILANTSYSFQRAAGLPKVQNEYGQGLNGIFNPTTNQSWGPKFGAAPTVANNLLATPDYRAYPNNMEDFFETGHISDNNITISGGDLKQNFSISGSYLTQTGILPNTSVKRTTVKFTGNTVFRNKIKAGASMTFTNTLQNGILGGNGNSSLGVLWGMARSIDLTSYKTKGTYKNTDGTNNFPIPSTDNPYFGAYENPLKSNLYRILGSVNVGYEFNSWLNLSYRLGIDAYNDRRKQIFAVSAARVPTGQVLENTIFRSEINGDLILSAHKSDVFIRDLDITGLVGQNINQRLFQSVQVQADALAIPDYYNVNSGTNFNVGSNESNTTQRLVGYYAQLSFAYKGFLYLELTGRADQSSTLPQNKNTYFYPSANAGFVFTDAFNITSDVLSYGKVRASIAKVGSDAPPYLLENTYTPGSYGNNVASFNFPFTTSNGTIAGFGNSTRIAPPTLAPEFTTAYEVGANVGLFKNRASIDVAYFNTVSRSQIFNVGISPSSGWNTQTINGGKMTNKGLELLINITPVLTRDFKWDISGNFTRIVNKVVSIAPGTDNFAIPGNAFTGSIPSIKVGQPYGVILGGVIPRDSTTGLRLINPSTGLYATTIANQVLSNPNPEYSLGFTNNVKYKGISLGFTFDFTKGGQVLSFTSAAFKSRGAWAPTAVDRDKPRILPGVIPAGGGKTIPNNIQITSQAYWQTQGGLQSEFNVYDATVFRLREISLGYDLPSSVIRTLHINYVRLSVFANNVFYVAPNSLMDPELNTQGAGNIRGLDLQSAPNVRTIGANLKVSL